MGTRLLSNLVPSPVTFPAKIKPRLSDSMAAPDGKHSLYKLVSPLERSGLQQGRLTPSSGDRTDTLAPGESAERSRGHAPKRDQEGEGGLHHHRHGYSPTHHYLDRKSERRQRMQPGVDPASSPRAPPTPSTDFPTPAEYTHSLSLSETEESPPTLVMPGAGASPVVSSSGRAVLVVDAGMGLRDQHSTEVEVTTTQAPSPAKVVRHKPSDGESEDAASSRPPRNWRRFSSDFVPILSAGQEERAEEHWQAGEDDEDTIVAENSTIYPGHMTSGTSHAPTNEDPTPDHSTTVQELIDLADSAHERAATQEAEEELGGVRKSASDEVMGTRQKETSIGGESRLSKSADLSTVLEESGSSLDRSDAARRRPKKKGHVVPSRYMTAGDGFKKPSQPATSHHQMSTSVSASANRTAKKITKSSTAVKAPRSKQDDSFKIPSIPLRAHRGRPPSHPSTLNPHLHFPPTPVPFTPSAMATSTPAVTGAVGPPSSWATHDGSFMALSGTSGDNTLVERRDHTSRITGTASKTNKSTSGVRSKPASGGTDWELELWYNRLLQATYLNVMSAKALREQEEEAMSQLHTLWQAVEQQKKENAELRRRVETEERIMELEKALEVQLHGLGPVCSKLPVLEQQYCITANALDTTRHEMTVSGMEPVTEDDLDAELVKSEHLLGEIIAATRGKTPKVCSFADSTEAVVRTLEKEFQELERCWEALGAATKAQVHETSLFFEERQRKHGTAQPVAAGR